MTFTDLYDSERHMRRRPLNMWRVVRCHDFNYHCHVLWRPAGVWEKASSSISFSLHTYAPEPQKPQPLSHLFMRKTETFHSTQFYYSILCPLNLQLTLAFNSVPFFHLTPFYSVIRFCSSNEFPSFYSIIQFYSALQRYCTLLWSFTQKSFTLNLLYFILVSVSTLVNYSVLFCPSNLSHSVLFHHSILFCPSIRLHCILFYHSILFLFYSSPVLYSAEVSYSMPLHSLSRLYFILICYSIPLSHANRLYSTGQFEHIQVLSTVLSFYFPPLSLTLLFKSVLLYSINLLYFTFLLCFSSLWFYCLTLFFILFYSAL